MSKRKSKAVFKSYDSDQMSLLPPSLEELIEPNHAVRIVREVVDQIHIDSLLEKYKGGGASSFHPRMMLKVIIYGYLCNTYSSRKIEEAVKSNIHFMWLAGMQRPDHNTINRFRSEKLKGVLKEVFIQVVLLLAEQGLVNIKTLYVDGTKVEANANKYTFVWGKAIKRNRERIKTQLEELWSYAEQVAKEELMDTKPSTFEQLDAQAVSQTIDAINAALQDKPVDKKVKQKLNYAKKHWPTNLTKYEAQEAILGERNSYSKTDPDATFMRMKDDHMRNGQLKAAYNWQVSTSDQYILNYDLYANPSDTRTLPHHLDQYQTLYGHAPDVVVADSGYGSEENYMYLETHDVEAYVKYNYFHQEQKAKGKITPKHAFRPERLFYNAEADFFVCPMGQRMRRQSTIKEQTGTGILKTYGVYVAPNCNGCPLRGACHKGKGNREIRYNHNLARLKKQARDRLLSDTGISHRSQRPADVEAVFGNIKRNKNFTRFMLRGKDKVLIEAGLIAIAHNLAKMAKN